MVAFIWLFFAVHFQMAPQIVNSKGYKVTLVAPVWLFSTVHYQMCPQMACMGRGIVTSVTFVRLFSIFLQDFYTDILQTKDIICKILLCVVLYPNCCFKLSQIHHWLLHCVDYFLGPAIWIDGFANCETQWFKDQKLNSPVFACWSFVRPHR